MKVSVYYCENGTNNYIMFVTGNKVIAFFYTYNSIEISRENIDEIVENIVFDDFKPLDFVYMYNDLLFESPDSDKIALELTHNELFETLRNCKALKIYEIE